MLNKKNLLLPDILVTMNRNQIADFISGLFSDEDLIKLEMKSAIALMLEDGLNQHKISTKCKEYFGGCSVTTVNKINQRFQKNESTLEDNLKIFKQTKRLEIR